MPAASTAMVHRLSSGASQLHSRSQCFLASWAAFFSFQRYVSIQRQEIPLANTSKSPRWLIKVGREAEGRYVLARLRGDTGADKKKAEAEFQDIVASCELERSNFRKQSYFHMLFGI